MQNQIKESRLSRGSELVLNVLRQTNGLYSAREIYDLLRSNREIDAPGMTTIYRSLESLLKLQMVQAVDLGQGEKSFESVEPGQHYHHLICTKCKSCVHLDNCFIENMKDKIQSRHDFQVRNHILEIFGICADCASKNQKAFTAL